MSGTDAVSCVIPAYNEAGRIGRVLAVVAAHPLVAEVVVVDDGSTDDTAARVATVAGVRLIRQPVNAGKSKALRTGLAAARRPLVMLLDADLTGLTADHVTRLITPVLRARADMAVSLRANTMTAWRLIGLDYISGERVFRKDLIAGRLDAIDRLPKFGFEVFLNEICITHGCRIAVVRWDGVASPFKYRKYGLLTGVLGDIGMMRDLFSVVSPWRLARQVPAMLRLRVSVDAIS